MGNLFCKLNLIEIGEVCGCDGQPRQRDDGCCTAPFFDLGIEMIQQRDKALVWKILGFGDVDRTVGERQVGLCVMGQPKEVVFDPPGTAPGADATVIGQADPVFIEDRKPHGPQGIRRSKNLLAIAEFKEVFALANRLEGCQVRQNRAVSYIPALIAQVV